MTHGPQNCYRWNVADEQTRLNHLTTLLGSYTETANGAFDRVGHTQYPIMSIHMLRFDSNQPPDTQTPHREDEIYYVLAGSADLQVGDAKFRVNPGDLIFVPRLTFHRFSNYKAIDMLVVFTPDYSGGTEAVEAPEAITDTYPYHYRNLPDALDEDSRNQGEPVIRKTLMGTANLAAKPGTPIRSCTNPYPSMSMHLAKMVHPKPDMQTPHWEDEIYLVLDVTHAKDSHAAVIMGNEPTKVLIRTGDLIFVPRHTFHRFEGFADLSLLIIFTPDYSVKTNMREIPTT